MQQPDENDSLDDATELAMWVFFRLTENVFEGFENRVNGIYSPSLTRIGS